MIEKELKKVESDKQNVLELETDRTLNLLEVTFEDRGN
ncbi:hypothetical protein Theba_0441 [Mesotoga prima MesG1.Ag.4.2]|uniref:Uncharacterized protein n=1 Tax=Mesotoga prima MesG1.Ag.4.2 TaxID=660470 RepID=I2F2L5_9BACT|nr:hypothetical protein Theba_0441 [Mesotoga prima MesG1.Ag.4.2]